MKTIDLDHNATTPTRPEVVEVVVRCLADGLGNPSSRHQLGRRARQVLEDARQCVAELLDADLSPARGDRLMFTSGGTEANNLAIFGIAHASLAAAPAGSSTRDYKGDLSPRLLVSAGEHPSVLEPAFQLLERGWRLDTLPFDASGAALLDSLPGLLKTPAPRLVSVQSSNHETGVVQPVAEIAEACRRDGVPFHTDAVQSAGKVPLSFRQIGAAAMSVAAHKFQGPPGVGALLLRSDVPIEPLFFGGSQQFGLRPGTEPVALAAGMAEALKLRRRELETLSQRWAALRDRFEQGLCAALPGVVINGRDATRLPQTSNVTFPGLSGEAMQATLDRVGVACSVGAACCSESEELSPTLRAMGLSGPMAAASLRFSFGASTSPEDIEEALDHIIRAAQGRSS